jgi:transcriptional regulator with XRE-family HTH domain
MGSAETLCRLMDERGISANALAAQVPCDKALISRYRNGRQHPSPRMAHRIDEALGAAGQLAALAGEALVDGDDDGSGDEIGALELARRAAATDVGTATVERLEQAVDSLAIAYPGIAPVALLKRVRAHLGYVTTLLEARKTLSEHRRLLTAGSWLSLLAATCMTDLGHREGASAHLTTAVELAREAGHPELLAWCLETRAWQVLTDGDYRQAKTISQAAQRVAPTNSSAFIQATAQEGRAWARLGGNRETYDALARVEALVSPLPMPDHPEHHYRYDPAKSEAYLATTLSWIGDPSAESHARQVLARLESPPDGPPRPRRAASARLDLALTLATTGRLDEAAGIALDAVTSRLLVPSNYWRAEEVITAVATRAEPQARDLRGAYREICTGPSQHQARPLPNKPVTAGVSAGKSRRARPDAAAGHGGRTAA